MRVGVSDTTCISCEAPGPCPLHPKLNGSDVAQITEWLRQKAGRFDSPAEVGAELRRAVALRTAAPCPFLVDLYVQEALRQCAARGYRVTS